MSSARHTEATGRAVPVDGSQASPSAARYDCVMSYGQREFIQPAGCGLWR